MRPELLIPILGLAFATLFSVFSLIEREGVSIQFVGEVTVFTVLATVGGNLLGSFPNPYFFLVFLYLITMRGRLMVDVAKLLIRRGRARDALAILQVGQRLLPDQPSRRLIELNSGIAYLGLQDAKTAQEMLEGVLAQSEEGGLGLRNRTMCHYFLGHALKAQAQTSLAKRHFRQASSILPSSPYARAAEKVLEEYREQPGKKANKP